jgi:hypothetical protein
MDSKLCFYITSSHTDNIGTETRGYHFHLFRQLDKLPVGHNKAYEKVINEKTLSFVG